ncbi:MAG: dipeptidase PepE [Gammaproteobacteria bacterium]|nr:MAG: dipeptidase PepE [Gammaproteobacteria bacterium]
MNLLLLSSSRVGKTGYLSHAIPLIDEFLNANKTKKTIRILFIPFAGVSIKFDEYESMVIEALKPLNIELTSIHHSADHSATHGAKNASSDTNIIAQQHQQIKDADCLLVGGGNTFSLLNQLYNLNLIKLIHDEVKVGKPYIGWSAGSNIAGASIKTTNDMPIVQPPSFNALNLIPCQLNPHYIEATPSSHNGETRQQRLEEFLIANPDSQVIAIPEGTALICRENRIIYTEGEQKETLAYLFSSRGKQAIQTDTDVSALLNRSSN